MNNLELYISDVLPRLQIYMIIIGSFGFIFFSMITAYSIAEKSIQNYERFLRVTLVFLLLLILGLFIPNKEVIIKIISQ